MNHHRPGPNSPIKHPTLEEYHQGIDRQHGIDFHVCECMSPQRQLHWLLVGTSKIILNGLSFQLESLPNSPTTIYLKLLCSFPLLHATVCCSPPWNNNCPCWWCYVLFSWPWSRCYTIAKCLTFVNTSHTKLFYNKVLAFLRQQIIKFHSITIILSYLYSFNFYQCVPILLINHILKIYYIISPCP